MIRFKSSRAAARAHTPALAAALVLGCVMLTGMKGCDTCANYRANITPADFASGVANPYYPLIPGTVYRYEKQTAEGLEEVVTTVTSQTRRVMGIDCIVVRDTSWMNGELAEDTFDWFAQDNRGNVWYFGEETAEYENGRVVSTAGSWEAGVAGAEPGIIMLAAPRIGASYRQEFLCGEAEDEARVVAAGVLIAFGGRTWVNCVQTTDFTRLAPEIVESKYYAPGIGFVLAEENDGSLALVSVTPPL